MKKLQPIAEIANKLGLKSGQIEKYGDFFAKIVKLPKRQKAGKLILVSAINPTKFGEGKTTVSIGLADSMMRLGENVCLSLRQPSLGPVFGIKGGATGGGKSTIEPSEKINLHFTGDFHAITAANNLLCAMIDNHIFQGNALDIDPERIAFHRCIDMNDRALRDIALCSGGLTRKESFVITAASEIMAIFCLAKDINDLQERLGNILVGFSRSGSPVFAKQLGADGAMTALLVDAIKPNLVQTANGTSALVHGGPFANIAHGCSSIVATSCAMSLADYVVTEAGFGGDLGGEKFIDVKCRAANIAPAAVVVVATLRALKAHSENGDDLSEGLKNLQKHIHNFKEVFSRKVIVAINKFSDDSEEEIQKVIDFCKSLGVTALPCSPFIEGNCDNLAKAVLDICKRQDKPLTYAYQCSQNLQDKIGEVCKKIYGAQNVEFSEQALEKLPTLNELAKNQPIVIAKTQYSLSDDENLKGCPQHFTVHIRDLEWKSGAGFVVAIAGKTLLMPGLPKKPNAENISVKNNEIINIK